MPYGTTLLAIALQH